MNRSQIASLQDEHLDLMLRLAYRRAAGEEIKQLIEEAQRAFTPEEEAQAQAGYALFLRKLDALRRRKKHSHKRRFPYLIEVAACVVLISFISLSVAVANVEDVRSKVLQLIIDFQEDHASVSFLPDENRIFEVPAGYMGDYYPTYIPAGYELSWISKIYPYVQYRQENGRDFMFEEVFEGTSVSVTAENASYYTVTINGKEVSVVDQPAFYDKRYGDLHPRTISLYWMVDDRMLLLMYEGELDEAMKIASSVKKIVK